MRLKNEKDTLEALKTSNLGVYFICGGEVFLKDLYFSWLRKKYSALSQDAFNYHEFSGGSAELMQIAQTIDTPPVFAPSRVVIIRNLGIAKLSQEDFDFFLQIIADIPSDLTLIIAEIADDMGAVSDKNIKKTIKILGEGALIIEAVEKAKDDLRGFARSYITKQGCSISPQNAALLAEYAKFDMLKLSSDLDKLISFRQAGEITRADIDALITPHTEMSIFALSKTFASGDYTKAMKILETLSENKEEGIVVLNAIAMHFKDILIAKIGLKHGKSQAQIAEDFGYKNRSFVISAAINLAAKISMQALADIAASLKSADVLVRGGPMDSYFYLEKLLSEIFFIISKERARV